MAKKGVSSKTHTKSQLDAYANQHNPNNKAFKSNKTNKKKMKQKKYEIADWSPDAGMGWCSD